jgi:hypothetical protein
MRELLDELKHVNGELEAPTKLEGLKGVVSKLWNESFFMGAKYVADTCATLLAVCGERLIVQLRVNIERLMKALRRVERAESEYTGGSHVKHLEKEATVKARVRLVAWVHARMYTEVLKTAKELTNTQGNDVPLDSMYDQLNDMKTDALAVALAAFLKAMKLYRQRHNEEFIQPFSDYENSTFPDQVDKLDRQKVN